MIVAIGSDHAGYELKEWLKPRLAALGHDPLDVGAFDASPSDYPDCARAVAETLLAGRVERGLLICGSGVGVSVAASKVPGIRAAVCHDTYSAHQGVEHDDMNVLVLGARKSGFEERPDQFQGELDADDSGAERHVRRLGKVAAIERDARAGAFDAPAIGR